MVSLRSLRDVNLDRRDTYARHSWGNGLQTAFPKGPVTLRIALAVMFKVRPPPKTSDSGLARSTRRAEARSNPSFVVALSGL
ncbi:unnamed protein product [Peniophora sp. CBMAI 1063]|nr:unnamed protein product [Peniophora sp. CBMAI 1063]